MPLFRKKPVTIEAEQYFHDRRTSLSLPFIRAVCIGGEGCPIRASRLDEVLSLNLAAVPHIHALGDIHPVTDGDWIIRGVEGVYICKSGVFEMTHEAVEAFAPGSSWPLCGKELQGGRRCERPKGHPVGCFCFSNPGGWPDMAPKGTEPGAIDDAYNRALVERAEKPEGYCHVCTHALFLHNDDGTCGCGINCPQIRTNRA